MARTSDVSRRIAFLNRKVFPALPGKLVLPARIAVGLVAVLAGGLGFTRAERRAPEKSQAGQASPAEKAKPGAAKSALDGLTREQISPYELGVAGSGDPAQSPPDLVAILGDSRLKMQWQVLDLVFTHDGRSLIGAGDRAIRFWDVVTGMQQRVLLGHTDSVAALAISADGKTLVSGSHDTTVKVWDLVAGKERLTLKGHEGAVSSVALSRDGLQVASCHYRSRIRLWASGDGRELKVLEGHGGPVHALAFNRDGKVLASAGDDGAIRLWDTVSGRSVKTLSREGERWRALAFSPDGKTLAAGGYDHGLVLWDTITWNARLRVPEVDGLGTTSLAYSGDGRWLALVVGFAARIIDAQTGEIVQQFPKQAVGINRIALGRDDATLAMSGWGVSFWDVAGGGETTPQLSGHHGGVDSLAFSPGGEQLATASGDGTVKLWDLPERSERLTLRGHANSARAVAFRLDGKALATVGFAPEVFLWELPSGKKLQTFQGAGDVSEKVFFSPDGRWLAAVALNRLHGAGLSLWDLETGGLQSMIRAGDGTYAFSPDSKKIVFAGNDGGRSARKRRVMVWDIAKRSAEQTIEDGDLPSYLGSGALSPDGRVLALAGTSDDPAGKSKAVAILWGLAEQRPTVQLEVDEGSGVEQMVFSRDGRTLLGVGRDGLGRLWDSRNGTLRETVRIAEPGIFVIRDVEFAPDGRHFGAAIGNGTVRIFRIKPAPEVVEPRPPLAVARAVPEPAGDLWKRLIGQPAPELRQIQAWDGGTPVTLADLRGRWVLLHFANIQTLSQMGKLMAVHEEFADQGKGLVVIVIQRDRGARAADFQGWKGILNGEHLLNRTVPFRLALDGGGRTAVPGTGAWAHGATHAAFGIHESAGEWSPLTILIDPDGKVRKTGGSVWTLERELEAAMGVKPNVPAWRSASSSTMRSCPSKCSSALALPTTRPRGSITTSIRRRGRRGSCRRLTYFTGTASCACTGASGGAFFETT